MNLPQPDDEEQRIRSVALQNAQSILLARQRAEQELIHAKEELERKTEALARTLSMMRATLESTFDGILVTDESGKVTDFNEQYVKLWRAPPEIVSQRDHQRLLQFTAKQLKQPELFLARVADIYASSPPESFDLLELVDGRAIERFSKIQHVDARDVGRVWTFRDITERRRVEAALEDEARVLELLNRTGAAIASTLELEQLVQAVTDASTELTGAEFGAFFYNTTDANGDSVMLYTLSGAPREALAKFDNPRASSLFGPTFNGEGPIRSDDILRDPRYGKWAPHHGMPPGQLPVRSYLAMPVISRSGEVIGGLFFGHSKTAAFSQRAERIIVGVAAQAAVAIDNARLYETAQKAAEERKKLLESEQSARATAERMSDLKDEFLATLSHELRTPLNSILGWAHVLRRGTRDRADFDKAVDTIERNARAQTQLIEDLLDMSRITSGKVRLDIQPIAPASFIEAAVETISPAADAKDIRIEKLLDPAAGPISGDPSRLQQVIWNLLANAIKFTPKGGKVQVVLQRVNSHIEISIADTGIGINPEFLSHAFERFRQADSSSTRRYGGLGLGLSIVKHLVELHGGTVHAESAGENRGATFAVHLPVSVIHRRMKESRQHPKTAVAAIDFQPLDLSGVTVLVVDDEADARELLERVLMECNAKVLAAGTAAEALLLIESNRPDVLISDIGMPDVDGFELLKRVRALGAARGGNVVAIALTAFARSEDRTRALLAGFLMHVSKPVEPADLVATVASVAQRNRAE
ncbi:MAG: ATP-binding protein [Betaproteobacteria bacterium]